MDLMQYLTAFGLATGAGTKATIPVLAIGLFHYTPYFELSPRWAWIASPPVLVVLSILLVFELWVDSHPELGEWADKAAYLPALISGFIAFAAATGTVHSTLLQLAASGLLGGVTSGAVLALRNRVRGPSRQHFESLHGSMPKLATAGEAGLATTIAAASIVAPLAGGFALLAGIASLLLLARMTRVARTPCPHCGKPMHPSAIACPFCSSERAGAT